SRQHEHVPGVLAENRAAASLQTPVCGKLDEPLGRTLKDLNLQRTHIGNSMSVPAKDPNEILHRILEMVEQRHRKGWVEAVSAIILSLATTSSAWCAYQSKIWSGVASSQHSTATEATQHAAENRLLAMEIRTLEAAIFIRVFEA